MKKIQSGQGASDVSAGTSQEQRMGRPIDLNTGGHPEKPGVVSPDTSPVTESRLLSLERRIKALEAKTASLKPEE